MREVVRQLLISLDANRLVAYCRLVETRGSTPQKAGAMMLVFADGSQAGTLGGGCVEAEVKRRALGILAEKKSEISTFQLDRDYGWDDGLICGGRMKILVEPVLDETTKDYYRQLALRAEAGQGMTEAVVFDEEASGLAAPASFLFDENSRLIASLHSQETPALITEQLRPLASRPRPYAGHGVAYMPVLRRCRLFVVGGGHVGKAVADLAVDLDFEVWVYGDREEYASAERFPRAENRITGPLDQVLPKVEITPDTYCLIVTRGHQHDEEALFHLVQRGARYVGLIGSRRKIKMIFEDLRDE
jgi:xanthine dehydrogenase accessory factor